MAAVAGSLVGEPRARAQSAEAEALFDEGNQQLKDGKIAAACATFEASNRVEPRAGTLIRLGECREQNQQLASAWSAFKDALTRVKDPLKRGFAQAKAAALEPRLSYLTVSVSDESRVDGLAITRDGRAFDTMLWNRALPVDGGDYVIAGRAPGHDAWQITAHVPVEGGKVSVEVPKFKELAKLIPPPSPPPSPSPRPEQQQPAPLPVVERDPASASSAVFTTRRKISLGVAAVSAAITVAGVLAGESSKHSQSDAFALCPDPATPCAGADRSNALLQTSHHRALEANLAFGAAAAAAITAGILWFTGAPTAESGPRTSVVPSAAPGQLGLVLTRSF